MGDYDAVMAIAAFFVFSFMVLIQGGAASTLFPDMEGQRPPQIVPSETDIGYNEIDLEADAFSSENITFVEPSDLQDPAFNTSKVAILESGTDSGYITYNTPGVRIIDILSGTSCGGLLGTSRLILTGVNGSGQSDLNLCAETIAYPDPSTNPNFIKFEFQPPDQGAGEPRLYSVRWSKYNENTGIQNSGILGALETVGAITAYPLRLWDYIEHFPYYINLFYGILLGYMLIAIIRGI